MTSHILVVDDEGTIRHFLGKSLADAGYEVTGAETGKEALDCFQKTGADLVLLDLKLPDRSGLDILKEIKKNAPQVPVLMMTAFGEVTTAVEAMKAGAYDYLIKPLHLEQVRVVVERALSEVARWRELEHLRRQQRERFQKDFVRGTSPQIQQIYDMVDKVAENDRTSVLINGESGTGKQVIAQLIHQLSPRAANPFLEINCGAIPRELLESELFGHERGAFTDARDSKQGLLELADKGSLFLDEIGEMNLNAQVKLLKVLDQMTFRRVGGTRDIRVNVRILSATNRNLEEAVKEGYFRDDLYYRLMVVPIQLPPLRERGDDVLQMARHFLTEFSQAFKKNFVDLAPATEQKILSYPWPGNIRELRNVMERTVLLENGETLEPHQLKIQQTGIITDRESLIESLRLILEEGQIAEEGIPFEELVADVEKGLIFKASYATGWNQSRTAELLRVTRDKLRYRMKLHGIKASEVLNLPDHLHRDDEKVDSPRLAS
ncbi:MAG: sigma-54 dependent transcriptional regulator [Candidatus Eisenbacteria bacterium]|uniref:Sigma-54 dependent transcriptional regulator n=1 Tax=Eiseniibacteriota bacterium TaxID=2212470 RepID=A0A948S0P3_UNCEI|nr:sigma-54 dependent transcriptional regulator [Candidatus Eisenbacteria bacterium]MBU1947494.1 sigma-54 dependent transcriptional regulator [Candidatus Eisenbacteria bacterium]MBU2691684.1 sigma-54 dependent transcriptional regulator [Candidatus Eisenbacteria bacterium]